MLCYPHQSKYEETTSLLYFAEADTTLVSTHKGQVSKRDATRRLLRT